MIQWLKCSKNAIYTHILSVHVFFLISQATFAAQNISCLVVHFQTWNIQYCLYTPLHIWRFTILVSWILLKKLFLIISYNLSIYSLKILQLLRKWLKIIIDCPFSKLLLGQQPAPIPSFSIVFAVWQYIKSIYMNKNGHLSSSISWSLGI